MMAIPLCKYGETMNEPFASDLCKRLLPYLEENIENTNVFFGVID